jgi:hypothetical protein
MTYFYTIFLGAKKYYADVSQPSGVANPLRLQHATAKFCVKLSDEP